MPQTDNQHSRLDEIGRTLRHAQATRPTETDSWLNGYQEDVAWFVEQYEAFKLECAEWQRIARHRDVTRSEWRERAERAEEQFEIAHAALTQIAADYSPAKRAGAEAALALTKIELVSNPASVPAERDVLQEQLEASHSALRWIAQEAESGMRDGVLRTSALLRIRDSALSIVGDSFPASEPENR